MSKRIATALAALLAFCILAAPAVAGQETPPPDIHDLELKQTLLADPAVSRQVKGIIRTGFGGGIARPTYADFTADGQQDVLVPIASGGTSGIVAFYVYSYHFGPLRAILARPDVYRVGLRHKKGDLVVDSPIYAANDANCCPSKIERRTLHFNGQKFRAVRTVIIRPRY
jgi:hypothetical protein